MASNRKIGDSPQIYARTAGFLYLIVIVAGIFAEMCVRNQLIVPGNATATANNIVAHQSLYRWGFVAELVACACNIPLAVIFYKLFSRVSKDVTLAVIFFTITGTAVESACLLKHFEPVLLLNGSAALGALKPGQLDAMAYASLQLFEYGFSIALVFFGFCCIGLGNLTFRSRFLPKPIGVLLVIEGFCYLITSFTRFIAPALASGLFPFLAISGLAEISFSLWLLIMGVNVSRWNEQAQDV